MLMATIAVIRIGQPTSSGTPIRLARSAMKPFAPRRWNVRWAKNPAIRKKVVMRKMCST